MSYKVSGASLIVAMQSACKQVKKQEQVRLQLRKLTGKNNQIQLPALVDPTFSSSHPQPSCSSPEGKVPGKFGRVGCPPSHQKTLSVPVPPRTHLQLYPTELHLDGKLFYRTMILLTKAVKMVLYRRYDKCP